MPHSNNQRPPAEILDGAIEAARTAGAMIRAEFHRPGGPRGTVHNAIIDTEIEEVLKTALTSLHPASWLGEETGRHLIKGADTWIIDPHDGTADFMKGLRGSAVSIALIRNGKPVLGVVYAPTAPDEGGDLIAWAEGGSLTRNGRPVESSYNCEHLTIALNADAADYAAANHITLGGARVRALPSPAYRAALCAVGEVNAAMSLVAGLSSWDIAGGHALLIGAGKQIAQRDGQEIDYRFNSFNGFVCGSTEHVSHLVGAKLTTNPKSKRCPAKPVSRSMSAQRLSRAQGTLLGQLAGDALGSFVEFQNAAAIACKYPDGVTTLRDGGTWNLIAGQPTDDSEMALALARSLSEHGCFDPKAVSKAYIEWRHSDPFDIGMTTSNAIAALEANRDVTSDSQANGALMRASPIGIFSNGDPEFAAKIAWRDAALTHPNPVPLSANSAYAAAISVGIAGGGSEEMWSAAFAFAGNGDGADTVRDRLLAARIKRPPEFQHQMGWVLTAFQNAFFELMSGKSLRDAVVDTVAQGGDTDTNAAICGALLGACQGREAVPQQWRNAVLTCRSVKAEGVRHPRPKNYWPDDALELAETLLTVRK